MEIHVPLLVLCISFLMVFLNFIKIKKPDGKRRPPGPRKLPLIGNLHNLAGGTLPQHAFHRLAQKFGPVMSIQLGEIPIVVISSADTAEEIMKTHDLNFMSRPKLAVAEIMTYGTTSLSLSPHGDHWRQTRKICTLELLSNRRVQESRPLRERVFADMCRRLAKSREVNFSQEFNSATYALIAEAVLGEEGARLEGLLPVVKLVPELAAGVDLADAFPSIRLFNVVSGLRKRAAAVHKEVDRMLEEVIRQKIIHRADKKEESKDFLDVLLRLQEDGLNPPITHERIKAVLLDMLGAGSDTSATLMDWAMSELVKNPKILKKAQEEARRVFDKEGIVDESRIPELKYLKSVLTETLRMHPPVALLIPRKCCETCKINGYEIAPETTIIINTWSVNRDPKYWEDPNCFKPERFMNSPVDFRGNNFEFIPFGAGRRMCPGVGLGLANVELPLAMFMYHFDWELGGGVTPTDLNMEERLGSTAKRLKDLILIPSIKRPLPTK